MRPTGNRQGYALGFGYGAQRFLFYHVLFVNKFMVLITVIL